MAEQSIPVQAYANGKPASLSTFTKSVYSLTPENEVGERLDNTLANMQSEITQNNTDISQVQTDLSSHLAANNPHNISISTIGAAASSHTHDASNIVSGVLPVNLGGTGAGGDGSGSRVTFVNKDLNSTNIDNVYNFNYVTSVAGAGFGTYPAGDIWYTVVNFYDVHFANQIAFEISNGMSAGRNNRMWIRQRYIFTDNNVWSSWSLIPQIQYSTADLTAGSSPLLEGIVYLVYE